jgi:PAS domain S-box-containing protein
MNQENFNDKSIKEKLESSEERFRIFVKNNPASVAMFDRDMRYIVVSDRWLEDYNIENEEVIGRSHYEIFPDISEDWVEIYQICMTGITRKGEDKIVTRGGKEEWIEWEIHPWYETSGEVGGIIIYAELITDRKNTEMELIKARERAEEASRAKSTFIANMSHEFRTPLNAILGYTQVMQNTGELSEEQRTFVEEISNGGMQLLSMINNVIDLSKIETSRITYKEVTFPVDQLIKDAVDSSISKFRKKGLGLTGIISKGVPKTLSTDFQKLERILQQLVSNAWKFTYRGEVSINIDFERVVDEGSGVNGKLFIIVSDTGIGIPEDKQAQIFKPFSKINSETREGTGLGLTLVDRLTRFLGGKVEVKSDKGEGSDFMIVIPVKASEEVYDQNKVFSFVDKTEMKQDKVTAYDISNFIKSLGTENKDIILEALELQDLEKLSRIDQYLSSRYEHNNKELKKLKKSARDFDFKFINEVLQAVE